MGKRQNISSGALWEDIHGYSRAVRTGDHVFVSGTVASDDQGRVIAPGSLYGQTAAALQKIARALAAAGATLDDVVRTRIYVTDIERWQEVARAHSEVFGAIRPASTMLEVSRLIGPEYLVEIEAEAVIGARP